MNSDLLHSEDFKLACSDYFYLIDRQYPEKSSLKIVGDRYNLLAELRVILYRGICSEANANARSSRIVSNPGKHLLIDGYNVLFTLYNYRLGSFVFVSSDNLVRDAGSLFGKIKNEKLFFECAGIFIEYLSLFPECTVEIYLDSPVSFSIDHKNKILQMMSDKKINGAVEVVHSADKAIQTCEGIPVATSDSALIDHCANPVFDLTRQILEINYKAELFRLKSWL